MLSLSFQCSTVQFPTQTHAQVRNGNEDRWALDWKSHCEFPEGKKTIVVLIPFQLSLHNILNYIIFVTIKVDTYKT